MRHLFRIIGIFAIAAVLAGSCQEDTLILDPVPEPVYNPAVPIDQVLDTSVLILDPSGYAPLSAWLELTLIDSAAISYVSVNVRGKQGMKGDLINTVELTGNSVELPVLGLYPAHNNRIHVSFLNSDKEFISDTVFNLQTAALPLGMPASTTSDVINPHQDINTMLMVSYAGGNHSFPFVTDVPFKPFIMDKYADIRWYVDYSDHPTLASLRFGHGFERLQNGNLYFGNEHNHKIYEIDMLGNVLNTWAMPGWSFHHEVWEKSNGNFLVCVDKEGASTIEDYVIELDRTTGAEVNVWDFNISLQNDRFVMDDGAFQGGLLAFDWIHQNGLTWDDADNTLIISGREQGTIKLTEDNQVVWIISNHRNWGLNGRGEDLNDFLLTPLDSDDQPITDTSVLNGWTNHPDFEWNWYQHSPLVTPEGTVMVFDNGGLRNWVDTLLYSRAVEYEIDAVNMTIKQKFQYGKERGLDLFAAIVSDVDYDPSINTVTFGGGTMLNHPDFTQATRFWGKSVEVDRSSGRVVSEYTVDAYKPLFFITFNRTEKMDLYVDQ